MMQNPSITNSLDNFLKQPNIEASPAVEAIITMTQQR